VLGQYIYSAENKIGAISSDVLANPYSPEISLDQNFLSVASLADSAQQQVPAQAALPDLEQTITDSHFFERDRMGRLVTFLARLVEDPQWTPPSPPGGATPLPGTLGIGIDESTALLIDTTGDATVIGNSPTNHVYFLALPKSVNRPALQPDLTWGTQAAPAILVHRATVGDSLHFDPTTPTWQALPTGESTLSIDYKLWVSSGTLSSSNGSIY
jgi:hypothetical protein